MKMHQVAIVNYESLRKFFVWDIRQNGKDRSFRLKDVVFCPSIKLFRSIIIDECHRVKDTAAQQTIFTKGLATGKEYIIMLQEHPVTTDAIFSRGKNLVSHTGAAPAADAKKRTAVTLWIPGYFPAGKFLHLR